MAFLKLRNAVASQEFTLTHLKKYLQEENMRAVYKLLGLTVPKVIKDKLALRGIDFVEYWPGQTNSLPPPEMIKSNVLGPVENRSMNEREIELLRDRRKAKEDAPPNDVELQFLLAQSQNEVETLGEIQRKQVEEISQLKLKVLKW